MGIIDTIKGWFNTGGVRVAITGCEDPFPQTHTVHTGTLVMTTSAPTRVLGYTVTLYAEWGGEGEDPGSRVECGVKTCTGAYDHDRSFPIDLRPGDEVDVRWCMRDVDIPMALEDADAPRDREGITYTVEVIADVKGSPEPKAAREIQVVAA